MFILYYLNLEIRGANQRMNPDFAESAPKVADFADFWPIFPADEV